MSAGTVFAVSTCVTPLLERVLEELMAQTDITIELLVVEPVTEFDERTTQFVPSRKSPSWAVEPTVAQPYSWLRAQLW